MFYNNNFIIEIKRIMAKEDGRDNDIGACRGDDKLMNIIGLSSFSSS